MKAYSAYGLTIQSAVELPELPALDRTDVTPDVVFRKGNVERVPDSVEGNTRRIQASPGRCHLTYDSIGSFLVTDGEEVRFDPKSPETVQKKVVRRLFENEMMALLLHQRGLLVLHGSAVVIDGNAVVFLGPRGAGKSTTAAAFHQQGYSMLEDDVVGIRFDGDTPTVLPGVPQLRLKPDAVDALNVDGTTRYPDDGGSGKRYQQLADVPDPAPLAGCYILQEGESFALETLAGSEPLFQLVASTYVRGLLSDTEATATHFKQCSRVFETTPFQRLQRPDDHSKLPTLIEMVADDLRSNESIEV